VAVAETGTIKFGLSQETRRRHNDRSESETNEKRNDNDTSNFSNPRI
jgi:hypothetical protein